MTLKSLPKIKKRIENPNTGSENIKLGHRDGIRYRERRYAYNENQETTYNGRNRMTKSRKNQIARRKGNLEILWNIGSRHQQTSGDERKHLKRISLENEKATRNKTKLQDPYKRDKYLGYLPRKVLGTK